MWCGYAWVTYRGTQLVASHECRAEHDWDGEDPIHVCSRCGHTPDIDTASTGLVRYRSGPAAARTHEEYAMPKLDTATAKLVHKSEGSATSLVDEDQYRLKLEKVIVSPKVDTNGNTYWIWTFSIVSGQTTGEKFATKSLRTNTGFTENQAWYPNMLFSAFGVKPNVDTDTLLGKELLAIVSQGEITGGSRKGQIRNNIDTFMSLDSATDDDDWDDDEKKDDKAKAAAADDDEPDF